MVDALAQRCASDPNLTLFGSNYQDVFAFLCSSRCWSSVRPDSGRSAFRTAPDAMHSLFDTRRNPRLAWAGIVLVGAALLALPFVLASAGTFWVRITNQAILYCFLALGSTSSSASPGCSTWATSRSMP
jgi:hypothetical protein